VPADPVPAIVEAEAEGSTAAIFADIRDTLHVDVVNLIWRHLATMPGALDWVWSTLKPLYLGPALADFTDTAALLASLDLLISVDTATAHLAGALGKPVWILLTHTPDWRWLLDRADSPWYPSIKLFRQKKWWNWQDVFDDVMHELRGKQT